MFDNVPRGGGIKIGRIAFLVFGAIPIAIFIRLFVAFPADTKGERLEGMMLVFLCMVLSLLIAAFGAIVIIWKALLRESFLFWLCCTGVIGIPGLYYGIMFLLMVLTVR